MRHRPSRPICVALFNVLFTAWTSQIAMAETVTLSPIKDNTLYQDPQGRFSNGSGNQFFAGRTRAGSIRRGLIAFDVAGAVPDGATINNVTLRLTMTRTRFPGRTITVHRVLADWGEGNSDAPGQEGGGTLAAPNDATWLHRFYPTTPWNNPGGDFAATESASRSVAGNGQYTWSGPGLIADVQAMLNDPSTNFGWLIRGPEAVSSAKRFGSRQHPTASQRPLLTIEFAPAPVDTVPPEIAVALTPDELWPPNHRLIEICADVTVTDNVDPNPSYVLASIVSNQGEGGMRGDIRDAEIGTPDTKFMLRAERHGDEVAGRKYTITYTAMDADGNVATAEVYVTVPHDRAPAGQRPFAGWPGGTGLRSIRPNPFNPSTTITFQLESTQRVALRVYDVRGALVRTLIEATRDAGVHSVEWHGRDERGSAVASGIYLLEMVTADYRSIRKLVVVK